MTQPVAVITGASRGIGKQLAIDFAKAGYDVVCLARSTSDQPTRLPGTVDETAELVRAEGQQALALPLNVGSEEEVASVAEQVFDRIGRCDVLINNAAVAPTGSAFAEPTRRWRLAVDVNLNGPFYMMYYFCPRMAQAGGGHVVNISSSASVLPEFGRASYTTTKAALEALSAAAAHELKERRVAVNCLRIELRVWSEGFAATLPGVDTSDFEDPVIVSDAVLWLAQQPATYTGNLHTLDELRGRGVVRATTRIAERTG